MIQDGAPLGGAQLVAGLAPGLLGGQEVEGLFPVGGKLKAHQPRFDVEVIEPEVPQVVEHRFAVDKLDALQAVGVGAHDEIRSRL